MVASPLKANKPDAAIQGSQQPEAQSDGVGMPQSLPKGIRWIAGGQLKTGLSVDQVATLIQRCSKPAPNLKGACKISETE